MLCLRISYSVGILFLRSFSVRRLAMPEFREQDKSHTFFLYLP